MSRYNVNTARAVIKHSQPVTNTTNAAGGLAFAKSDKWELASMVATALLKKTTSHGADKYYETEAQFMQRLIPLVQKEPLFAAQVAVWARTKMNLRSISHILTAMIGHVVKGEEWTKDFHNAVLVRGDDPLEVWACFSQMYRNQTQPAWVNRLALFKPEPYPHSMQKGIKAFLQTLGAYQLAKYRGDDKAVSMVDLFNVLHPAPRLNNAQAFTDLIKGNLKNEDTWEARLSKAGSNKVLKCAAWRSLLQEKKLGYMALLKNLRNIAQLENESVLTMALQALTNENFVARSRILPFRFVTAYGEIMKEPGLFRAASVAQAISQACDISCRNVPVFGGNTLIAFDESGSMFEQNSADKATATSPLGLGGLMAAAIIKSNPAAEFMYFANMARYVTFNPSDSLMSLYNAITSGAKKGGTQFHAIYTTAQRAYDNIIILSDQEGWGWNDAKTIIKTLRPEAGAPISTKRQYEQKFKCRPNTYVFDLTGAGEMMFPEDRVLNVAGFSDHVFTLMRQMQAGDKQAVIREIESIDFKQVIASRDSRMAE